MQVNCRVASLRISPWPCHHYTLHRSPAYFFKFDLTFISHYFSSKKVLTQDDLSLSPYSSANEATHIFAWEFCVPIFQYSPSLASASWAQYFSIGSSASWAQYFTIGSLIFASLHELYHLNIQIKRRVHVVSSNIKCSFTHTRSKFEFLNSGYLPGHYTQNIWLAVQAFWCQDPSRLRPIGVSNSFCRGLR